MSNNIVTSVSALTDDDSITNISDTGIVCIDIEQGFMGIHKSNPSYHLDVSGIVQCNTIIIDGSDFTNTLDNYGTDKINSNIIPFADNSINLGSLNKRWKNAYIGSLSVNSIDISANLNPLTDATGSLGSTGKYWGNSYIRDLSIASIDVATSLTPLTNARGSLGVGDRMWGNAYIRNISAGSIDVSVNLNPLTNGIGSLGVSNRMWGNAYIRDLSEGSIDVSVNCNPLTNNSGSLGISGRMWGNAYIRDLSIGSIDISVSCNPLTNGIGSLGVSGRMWGNAYIRDLCVNSINGISAYIFITNINTNLTNTLINRNLGLSNEQWSNAYIRDMSIGSVDISVNLNMKNNSITNINTLTGDVCNNSITTTARIYQEISKKPIYETNTSYTYENNTTYELNTSLMSWEDHKNNALSLGKTLAVILNSEQNEIVKTLAAGDKVYIGGLRTSTSNISGGKTSADWLWMTGNTWSYTKFNSTQPDSLEEKFLEMNPTGTWNDTLGTIQARAIYMSTFYEDDRVNGYYGLAKDVYPSLNPSSNGALAVSSWTGRNPNIGVNNNDWNSVCWFPELGIFVAIGSGNTRVMISYDGISWTPISHGVEFNSWTSICWSPQLRIFVAVASDGNNRVMISPDGTIWTSISGGVELNSWRSVCWSPQLGLFVAVASSGNYRLMTSPSGTGWTTISLGVDANAWNSVCWSSELKIFVAVASSGNNRVMTSPNGRSWTTTSQGVDANAWQSICWSPELGIFVAVASSGNNRVMTSSNGRSWTGSSQGVVSDCSWNSISWSPELRLFVVVASSGNNRVMTSANGTIWTQRLSANESNGWRSICWSPEQGLFVAVSNSGTSNRVMTSSLKWRPPTSYNVFDSSFNSIDESGNWTFSKITSPDANITDLFVNNINGQDSSNLIDKITRIREHYGII